MELLAKTFAGLEPVLAKELEDLGAENVKQLKRAVSFEGDHKTLYRANLELHTALRILLPIKKFRAPHEESFYKQVKKIDWSAYINVSDTFAVDAVTYSKHLSHSKFIALRTKDAIVDQFRSLTGKRPDVDTQKPTIKIHVHINKDECSIGLDSSGEPLYKRGYRVETLDAPLNEVLAAGLIQLSGWEQNCDFIDPMCGSGTLLVEAAFVAFNIPPMINRAHFGFMNWKEFDPKLWDSVYYNAKNNIKPFDFSIKGFDRNFKAIKITQQNILAAHLEGKIEVGRSKFEKLDHDGRPALIIMNPPYDERLEEKDINGLYKNIGDKLKGDFSGSEAWIISSNKEALKHIGLKPSKKITLFNGPLECKFQKFELYRGSRKAKKEVPAMEDETKE